VLSNFASLLTTRDGLIAQLDTPRYSRDDEPSEITSRNDATLAQARTSSRRAPSLLSRLRSANA
jgi:hypothetical protein